LCLMASFLLATEEDKAVQRLRQIEKEIRSRASEADAEVAKTKKESEAIETAAAIQAKKIRDDATAYANKIDREIKEIQKGMIAVPEKGAPSRGEMAQILQFMTDPLLACFTAKDRAALHRCLSEKFHVGMAGSVERKFPGTSANCKMTCE